MLKFLKKLFREEIIREDIKLENLEQWFKEKTESFFTNFREFARENINEFNTLLGQLTQNIKELENAEIPEKEKIDDRTKSIVLGHRTNYIRRLNLFHRNIILPENLDYEIILDFLTRLEDELNSLSKETEKSFYATQHLFHREAEEIAKIIAKISDLRNKFLKNIEEKNLIKIIETKNQIKKLNDLIEKQQCLNKQLEEEENKLQEIEKLKKTNLDKLGELKQSREYTELNQSKEKLADNKNEINEIKNNILNLFAPLESGLRKYERISLNNIGLIRAYLDDATIALLGDRELKISTVLEKFKQSIMKGSIDLKDKKRSKTIEAIDRITKETLEKILLHYDELNTKKQEIEKNISENNSLEKEKDIKYKIENFNNSLNRTNKSIGEIKHSLEKININKEKENIQNSVKEILRMDVNIMV